MGERHTSRRSSSFEMKPMHRLCLTAIVLLTLSGPALAQAPQDAASAPPAARFPVVTLGVVSFLQYSAELEEADGFNAFDVTRGHINIEARLSNRVRARFTPDVRRVTDATLAESLALRLEYAYLEVDATDGASIAFGMHETPWLTFEDSINRYRVQGPQFAERQGLIPGPSDVGASLRARSDRTEVHVGVYNGEGNGRVEKDKYKSVQGRVTVRPFSADSAASRVRVSGFYSYGKYAADRSRNVAIMMGSVEHPHVVATAQYLFATDNPFVTADIERRGMSFFGEGRQGPTGWAGLGRVDFFDPNSSIANDSRRRYIVGGAHWSQWGRGRVGVVVTLEQLYRVVNSDRLERRLLAQTHVEF
jgi:hypothetical protein